MPDAHHLPLQTSLDDNGILNGLETASHGAGGEYLFICSPRIHARLRESFFSQHKSAGFVWLTRGPFRSSRVPPSPRPAPFPRHGLLVGCPVPGAEGRSIAS